MWLFGFFGDEENVSQSSFRDVLRWPPRSFPRSPRLMKHVINGETAFLVRRASIFTIIRGFSLLKHLRTI